MKKSLGCKDVVVSRRFAKMRSGKPRIIDDLKESALTEPTQLWIR